MRKRPPSSSPHARSFASSSERSRCWPAGGAGQNREKPATPQKRRHEVLRAARREQWHRLQSARRGSWAKRSPTRTRLLMRPSRHPRRSSRPSSPSPPPERPEAPEPVALWAPLEAPAAAPAPPPPVGLPRHLGETVADAGEMAHAPEQAPEAPEAPEAPDPVALWAPLEAPTAAPAPPPPVGLPRHLGETVADADETAHPPEQAPEAPDPVALWAPLEAPTAAPAPPPPVGRHGTWAKRSPTRTRRLIRRAGTRGTRPGRTRGATGSSYRRGHRHTG